MATAVPAGALAVSLEDLPGPAFLLDGAEGSVGAHNAAFVAWAGRGDPTGLTLAELLPGDGGAVRLWTEARAAGAAEHYVERRGQDGEGSLWCLRARRTPSGVLVCAGDLSAIASAAHAVHAAERDYVAVAAHELRAPLAAIKAWASALDGRRKASGGDVADGLGAIARQVDRMNELLTDLFDAARAAAGALAAERAAVPLSLLVRGALASTPHGVHAVVAPELPGEVHVDAVHIEAVIGRVIGWIAARAPGARIDVEAVRDGREIHLVVADHGPELSRAAEGEIFARAVRGGRGRGLGLYLCQQLAAASGGRIFRERTGSDGRGAHFVLALPDATPGAHFEGLSSPPRATPARVLVGEPDPVRRARALAALRLEGYEADGVADGARLLWSLDEGGWDVVVADSAHARSGGHGRRRAHPRAGGTSRAGGHRAHRRSPPRARRRRARRRPGGAGPAGGLAAPGVAGGVRGSGAAGVRRLRQRFRPGFFCSFFQ